MRAISSTPVLIVIVGLTWCTMFHGTNAFNSSTFADDDNNAINSTKENVNNSDKEADGSASTSNDESSASSASENSGSTNSQNSQQNNGSIDPHTAYYYNNNNNNGSNSQRLSAKYDDEQTYLDLFGERAKELLTQHIIPSTDAQCRWDWRMGRCEPYCICGFNFLWGDYHLGRSCRLRPNPPPSHFSNGAEAVVNSNEETKDETSWQEAWQEVWHSQMAEGKTEMDVDDDEDDNVPNNFVPPMFPRSQQQSNNNVMKETTTPSSWDETTTCTLPPESRYIQVIQQLTRAFTHSTKVRDKYQQLKNVTSNAVNATMVHGQIHWTIARQRACETVKRKVEERAKIRNQPVVLTRQGALWIRRVCGATAGNAANTAAGGGDNDTFVGRWDETDNGSGNSEDKIISDDGIDDVLRQTANENER